MISNVLVSFIQDRPLHILVTGRDTNIIHKLLTYGQRFTQRAYVHTCGQALTAKVTNDQYIGAKYFIEGGSLLLAREGICYIGELTKFKKAARDQLKSVLNSGKISVDLASKFTDGLPHTMEIPNHSQIWAYTEPNPQGKSQHSDDVFTGCDSGEISKVLLDSFSILQYTDVCDLTTTEEVALHTAHQILQDAIMDGNLMSMENAFSYQDLKQFIQHARTLRPSMTPEADKLIQGYFIASRKARSSNNSSVSMPMLALPSLYMTGRSDADRQREQTCVKTLRCTNMNNLSVSRFLTFLFQSFTLNLTKAKDDLKGLKVKYNKQSATITFDSDILDLIEEVIKADNLTQRRTDQKNGEIYKNDEGSITVTLYRTTNTIHVQGQGHKSWTQEFIKRLTDDDGPHSTGHEINVDSLTEPKYTSTPRNKQSTRGSINDFSDSINLDMFDPMEKLKELMTEIWKLKEKINQMEKQQRDAETQTEFNKTFREMGMMTTAGKTSENGTMTCGMKKTTTDTGTMTFDTTHRTKIQDNQTPTSTPKPTTYAGAVKDGARKSDDKFNTSTKTPMAKTLKKTLIVGSSLLQRINTRGLTKDTRVKTMRGAHARHVKREIEEKMNVTEYKSIILQVGGNDVDARRPLGVIEEDLKQTVNGIKKKSSRTDVYIAEILPRKTTDVSEMNRKIKSICELTGAKLIKTTDVFRYVNYTQYWSDLTHLTDSGTADLLKCYNDHVKILNSKREDREQCCFYCGENGHSIKNCHHGAPVQCYACGGYGHKAKLCLQQVRRR
ncbi:hypothetical protein FSP39_023735 [Pinctada imbricata]|uniref:CCHC-type domain-containing protein n=1 Tax=Pinctada imbricata TaxID=66713 RepID=A0AA88YFH9_PINIB|nr:hypothetical protein FSP39_023735 [Pinctada imbricata]